MLVKNDIEPIIRKLRDYKSKLKDDDIEHRKVDFCISVLEEIEDKFDYFIENTPVSNKFISKYISDRFITLEGISDELYFCCARFLREYILSLDRKNENDVFLRSDWDRFKEDVLNFKTRENEHHIEYLLNSSFDIFLINHYLGDKSFQAFLNYENTVSEAEQKIGLIDKRIETKLAMIENFIKDKEKKVSELAEVLKEQKNAFNFVGLSKGFEKLLSEKRYAKWASFVIMSIFCISLIAIPAMFLGGRFFNWFSEYNIQWDNIGWENMLPVLGLEFVFIYFFRVVLNHYNSIQTQIMQIELRQSLCQFIQSYAEYAKEIKEKDGASLEKFENLIFSSILSTPDKVPSTFDGIEQLSNLIKNIKG